MDITAPLDPVPPDPDPEASAHDSAHDAAVTRRRHATTAFAALGAVQVALVLAITVVSVSMPALQREFSTDAAGLVLAGSAYGLSFGGLLLLGGRLTDLIGRLRALRSGVGLFAVASAVAALAPDLEVFVAARFAQGCGAALAAPAAVALVRASYPQPARRARAMAWWGGLAGIGATSGMVLSGVVTTWGSWRWGLLVPVPVAAVAVALAPRLFPPDDGPEAGARVDLAGAALAGAGLPALGYGLTQAVDHAWSTPTVWAPMSCGAVLLAAFAVVEARVADPLLPLSLLASRRLLALAAIMVASGGMAGTLFLLSLYFQQVGGMSPARTSAAILPFGLVLVAVGAFAGPLTGRFGAHAVTAGGLATAAVGSLVLARLNARVPYAAELPVGFSVLGAGVALTFAGAAVAAFDGVTDRQAGPVGGVVNTAMEIGPPVGLAVLMSLAAGRTATLSAAGATPAAAVTGGYAFAFGLAGAAFAVTALLATVTSRTGRTRSGHAPLPFPADPAAGPRRFHISRSVAHQRTATERTPSMNPRFTDRVVLVTGGGSGIGRAAARAFAHEGATVVVAGRTPEPLAHTVELINADGGRADAAVADVTRSAEVSGLIERTVRRHGGLHVAFNNAGVFAGGPLAHFDEEAWANVVDVNLTGVFLSMKYEIAHMRAHGGGVIVNTASNIGAHLRFPGTGAYAAAKAAVSALTRTAARECIADGIRINAVSPGPIDTPMSMRPGETEADRTERLKDALPIGRVGSLEEAASAVLWLASAESGFAVGHDLVIDGGASA